MIELPVSGIVMALIKHNGIEKHRCRLRLVKRKTNTIDVGCGSRFIDLLVEQGFDAENLDL